MRRLPQRPRAFSLMDLLVSMLLGSIISYLIFLFWTGIGRHYYAISEKIAQRERASIFESVVAKSLEKTTPDGITIDTTTTPPGQTVAVQLYSGVVPPGRLRWSDQVVVFSYDAQDRRITSWQTSLSQIGLATEQRTHPEPVPQSSLAALTPPPAARELRTWDDIAEFQVSRAPGSTSLKVLARFEQVGVRDALHRYLSDKTYPNWNDFEP